MNHETPDKPGNTKYLSAYMAFIGRKGGHASKGNHKFTTEHQQQAALARWQKHNQKKDQLINESQQIQQKERSNCDE